MQLPSWKIAFSNFFDQRSSEFAIWFGGKIAAFGLKKSSSWRCCRRATSVAPLSFIKKQPRFGRILSRHCCPPLLLQDRVRGSLPLMLVALLFFLFSSALLVVAAELKKKTMSPLCRQHSSPESGEMMALLSPVALCREFLQVLARRIAGRPADARRMSSFRKRRSFKAEQHVDECCAGAAAGEGSILDLPELALECILERLPPEELRTMGGVCREMRDRCRSDYYWERHMKEKWGRVIGGAARKEWQRFLASQKELPEQGAAGAERPQRMLGALADVWPLPWIWSVLDGGATPAGRTPVLDDSVMSWYLAMESGLFWFPAQVYNREHGHVGFIMSCYDAELRYDARTDTFQARYPPHGRRPGVVEEGVQWDRIRAAPVDTSAHDLHASDCLSELRPGDHIEIQWRRNKEFPYGWWYGVAGHLEQCDGNEHFCRCHLSETVMLQFNQYTAGSRWRQTAISRKDHREEGNESDGFYGGVRKLRSKDEIAKWKQLWPADILE